MSSSADIRSILDRLATVEEGKLTPVNVKHGLNKQQKSAEDLNDADGGGNSDDPCRRHVGLFKQAHHVRRQGRTDNGRHPHKASEEPEGRTF